jgi:hypothetical protein
MVVKSVHWLFVFLRLFVLANVANAQSKDKDNPTRLTSNEISQPIYADNRNETIYYSFEAGPGEVTITLNLKTARNKEGGKNEVQTVLFNETGKILVSIYASATKMPDPYQTEAGNKQQVASFALSRRQKVTMSILFTNANTPGGNYQLLLGGAVNVSQDAPAKRERVRVPAVLPARTDDYTEALYSDLSSELQERLPKKGTLNLKMKDGSIKRID